MGQRRRIWALAAAAALSTGLTGCSDGGTVGLAAAAPPSSPANTTAASATSASATPLDDQAAVIATLTTLGKAAKAEDWSTFCSTLDLSAAKLTAAECVTVAQTSAASPDQLRSMRQFGDQILANLPSPDQVQVSGDQAAAKMFDALTFTFVRRDGRWLLKQTGETTMTLGTASPTASSTAQATNPSATPAASRTAKPTPAEARVIADLVNTAVRAARAGDWSLFCAQVAPGAPTCDQQLASPAATFSSVACEVPACAQPNATVRDVITVWAQQAGTTTADDVHGLQGAPPTTFMIDLGEEHFLSATFTSSWKLDNSALHSLFNQAAR